MRVFVTGHRGRLGPSVVNELKKDYKVVGYDLREKNNMLDYKRVKRKMAGCDYVVHVAAIPGPKRGEVDDYYMTNIQCSYNVMRAAMENKVKRFIFFSSVGYYGSNIDGKLFPLYLPLDESHPVASLPGLSEGKLDVYCQSKVVCEELLAWFGRNRFFEAVALRFGAVLPKSVMYKPGWEQKKDVYRKGSFWANCHPSNVPQAVRLALEADGPFWYEAFNIVDKHTPKQVDVKAFLRKEYPDVKLKNTYREGLSLVSPQKAETVLGFKPCEEVE